MIRAMFFCLNINFIYLNYKIISNTILKNMLKSKNIWGGEGGGEKNRFLTIFQNRVILE